MMPLHPWIIRSWPIVELPVEFSDKLFNELHHLGTVVSDDCDEYGRLLGHTVWSARDERIGLAWDWTETLDGVFALSDPMAVISNIAFVRADGSSLGEGSSTVRLNRIAHTLSWQGDVAEATRIRRLETPWSCRALGPTPDDYQFVASTFGETSWMS